MLNPKSYDGGIIEFSVSNFRIYGPRALRYQSNNTYDPRTYTLLFFFFLSQYSRAGSKPMARYIYLALNLYRFICLFVHNLSLQRISWCYSPTVELELDARFNPGWWGGGKRGGDVHTFLSNYVQFIYLFLLPALNPVSYDREKITKYVQWVSSSGRPEPLTFRPLVVSAISWCATSTYCMLT